MNKTNAQLYNILKEKIESHEAKAIIDFLDNKLKEKNMKLFFASEDPLEARLAVEKSVRKIAISSRLLFCAFCAFWLFLLLLIFAK